MELITSYLERPLKITLSAKADKVLKTLTEPLVVEMELYFSCLIRKQVNFIQQSDAAYPVTEHLSILFRPVMTEACEINEINKKPSLVEFPMEKVKAYTPRWLKLDYINNQWRGEFGYV